MRVATGATRLGAGHAIAGVGVFGNVFTVGGGEETWPSGPRIKLRIGSEQQIATADAVIGAVVVLVPVLPGKCALGTGATRDLVLLRSELLLPLGVRLLDLVDSLVADLFCHIESPTVRCLMDLKVSSVAPRWKSITAVSNENQPLRGSWYKRDSTRAIC